MNYIYAENLRRDFGERVLFENLTFSINKGEKVALVANNGTGKSCLLQILAGYDTPNSGTVQVRKDLKIGFLPQEPSFNNADTIKDLVKTANSKVLEIIRNYEAALDAQSQNYNQQTETAFNEASALMDKYNAWDYERSMTQILTQFNISDQEQKINTLSGGQKKRLALALVLLDSPELLILDEPTNHLDIDMIEWLEKHLSQSNLTLLMVTHDRYFLDNVCDHIIELDEGKLYKHNGNYSYFLEKRIQRKEINATEVEKANKLMKKELEWMRRMPKARGTKSKARIDNFYNIKDKAESGEHQQELKLDVKMTRMGGKILEMKKVYKNYDSNTILKGFDYTFKKGERIGIIGANGTGKSTFLNIITGKEKADSGKINVGDTIVYGYYSQAGIKLKEDKRVIEVLKDIAEVITLADGSKLTASQFLQYFMFPPEMQYNMVSKLSGGERRRLYLLTVLIKNPNFLILDEPTNDLDLITLNKLEAFLSNFAGCLIIVSHDRYFMDKLVDHLFVFEGNGNIRDFNGNYTQYRIEQEEKSKIEKEVASSKKNQAESISQKSVEKKKLSYKEKLEHESLEKEIELLEQEKANLEETIYNNKDYQKLEETSKRLGEVSSQIDEKTMRWMELDELV